MPQTPPLLTDAQRAELEEFAARVADTRAARRVQVVLLSVQGVSGIDIARRLKLSRGQVSRIRQRFLREGVQGLADRPRPGRKDHAVPRALAERLVALASSPPPPGAARWSTRLLAREVGLTSATVAKILRVHAAESRRPRPERRSRPFEALESARL